MKINEMLQKSRYDAGLSQQQVADKMNINKTTIKNWEAGYSSPSLDKTLEWFEVLGIPMYPYLISMLYPTEMQAAINQDESKARETLHKYIDELDDFHVNELLYLLYGSHGSSPTGTLDSVTAYLHLPLALRVCITENILCNYEMAAATEQLVSPNDIIPKLETLKRCVTTAKKAVEEGKNSYVAENK